MEPPAVLIYDGACRFCQGGMHWIEARARPGMFEFLPCQSEARRRRFPSMPESACMEAMQLALPDGRILGGAEALPAILARIRGWRWVAGLLKMPGAGLFSPYVYGWVARHRYAISCMLPDHRDRHDPVSRPG